MNTRPSYRLRPFLLVTALGLSAAAQALPIAHLNADASGTIHSSGLGPIGPFVSLRDVSTGPLTADVVAGAVLAYNAPGFPDWALEATLTAGATAVADYGTNGAAVKSSLSAVSGTDRGSFLSGNMTGDLGVSGFGSPVEMFAQSSWIDVFTIFGGTGLGVANIEITLDGSVTTGYGENGTAFYDEITGTFQAFGTLGFGFLNYGLDVRYDTDPIDFGGDGPPPVIRLERSFSPPLPTSTIELGDIPPEILLGSFIFAYGIPFSLESNLSLRGLHQIDMDFAQTLTLSLFDLPDGASLVSASGRIYPTELVTPSPVPEPATLLLFAAGLAGLGFGRRRQPRNTAAAIRTGAWTSRTSC